MTWRTVGHRIWLRRQLSRVTLKGSACHRKSVYILGNDVGKSKGRYKISPVWQTLNVSKKTSKYSTYTVAALGWPMRLCSRARRIVGLVLGCAALEDAHCASEANPESANLDSRILLVSAQRAVAANILRAVRFARVEDRLPRAAPLELVLQRQQVWRQADGSISPGLFTQAKDGHLARGTKTYSHCDQVKRKECGLFAVCKGAGAEMGFVGTA